MKTLDEAIDYAQMIVPMTDAPDTKDMWTSIEHYLEIYRELSKMWNDRLDKENQNDPLTLDELRAMGGKPVWIEYIDEHYENEWLLVVKNPDRPTFGMSTLLAFVKDSGRMYLTISGYGKRWQAYQKERK